MRLSNKLRIRVLLAVMLSITLASALLTIWDSDILLLVIPWFTSAVLLTLMYFLEARPHPYLGITLVMLPLGVVFFFKTLLALAGFGFSGPYEKSITFQDWLGFLFSRDPINGIALFMALTLLPIYLLNTKGSDTRASKSAEP
jgi:hypothetical protein